MRRNKPATFRVKQQFCNNNSAAKNNHYASSAHDLDAATAIAASSSMMLTTLAALVVITLATASADAGMIRNCRTNDLPFSTRPLPDKNEAKLICKQVRNLRQKLMATARKMIGSSHFSSCAFETCIRNLSDNGIALHYFTAFCRLIPHTLLVPVNLLNIPPPAAAL